jgi:hypothetical protein
MKAKVHTGDDMPKEFREKTDLAHALADKLLCIIESEGLADYDIGINALAHALAWTISAKCDHPHDAATTVASTLVKMVTSRADETDSAVEH